MQAFVLLAYMERRVHQAAIIDAAAKAGLSRASTSVPVADAWSKHDDGLYQLLCFQRTNVAP